MRNRFYWFFFFTWRYSKIDSLKFFCAWYRWFRRFQLLFWSVSFINKIRQKYRPNQLIYKGNLKSALMLFKQLWNLNPCLEFSLFNILQISFNQSPDTCRFGSSVKEKDRWPMYLRFFFFSVRIIIKILTHLWRTTQVSISLPLSYFN